MSQFARAGRLAAGLLVVAVAVPLLLAAPASAAVGSELGSGGRLNGGGELAAGGYTLNMQTDGNLVEYHGSAVVWASGTPGQPGNFLVMQTDGNLVVYSSSGAWRWQTTTVGHAGARLDLQTGGNVVVYSGATAVWAQTWRQSASGAQAYALQSLGRYGWASSQNTYLVELWNRESNWRWNAQNASSGAYGIPQALPASKLAANGPDWQNDGQTQVAWGLDYISSRYGTPQAAWSHEQSYGWY